VAFHFAALLSANAVAFLSPPPKTALYSTPPVAPFRTGLYFLPTISPPCPFGCVASLAAFVPFFIETDSVTLPPLACVSLNPLFELAVSPPCYLIRRVILSDFSLAFLFLLDLSERPASPFLYGLSFSLFPVLSISVPFYFCPPNDWDTDSSFPSSPLCFFYRSSVSESFSFFVIP